VIEGYAPYRPLLELLLERFETGEVQPVTSALTLAEVLVKPLRDQARELVETYYRHLMVSPAIELAEISTSVLWESARIRASSGARLYDAIHVATARLRECGTFLTNDHALRVVCPDFCVILDNWI